MPQGEIDFPPFKFRIEIRRVGGDQADGLSSSLYLESQPAKAELQTIRPADEWLR
jgi:hypothetical protein